MRYATLLAAAVLLGGAVVLLAATARAAGDDEAALREAIIAHVRSTGPINVYVDAMGRTQRAKLLRAAAEGLVVEVTGAELPIRWSGLSAARFAGIAAKAAQGKGDLSLILARYCLARKLPDSARKALDAARAAGADPAAVRQLERELNPPVPSAAAAARILPPTVPSKTSRPRKAPPPPGAGLAWKYIEDQGIARDPDVILFEDYEIKSIKSLRSQGWRSGAWQYYEIESAPGLAFGGRSCLKKIAIAGHGGAIMPRDLKPPETGPVYHRVYVKFPANAASVRVMGITGVRDGWPTWKAIGSAGIRPTGTNYYCVTLTCQRRGNRMRFMFYPYHMDQKGPYGDNWHVNAPVPFDTWLCVEIMVKLNTPGSPPKADGELRMWIDGKEVFTKTDLRYRSTDSIKTTMIFDQNYTSRKFANDFVWHADNRVLARKYIGPLRRRPASRATKKRSNKPITLPDGSQLVIVGGIAVRRYPAKPSN